MKRKLQGLDSTCCAPLVGLYTSCARMSPSLQIAKLSTHTDCPRQLLAASLSALQLLTQGAQRIIQGVQPTVAQQRAEKRNYLPVGMTAGWTEESSA